MKISKIAVLILFLLLGAALAGCGSGTPDIILDNEFTLSDLENANTSDAVFAKYASVRAEAMNYGAVMDFDEPTDFIFTVVRVKGNDGVNVYEDTDRPALIHSIEDGAAYYLEMDGVYGQYGFFDDGAFEEYFFPYTQVMVYRWEGVNQHITSVETKDGIRFVTLRMKLSDFEDAEYLYGTDDGEFESVYALDLETNLIQSGKFYVIEDGKEPWLVQELTVTYGMDDNFSPPEYVLLNKDMSVTRTVRVIFNAGDPDEKEFIFTLPKDAAFYPFPMGEYEHFADADLTVPYEDPVGEYPDETVIYMKRK